MSVRDMKMGSRRGVVFKVRSNLSRKIAGKGIPFAEIGTYLGISTSAVSQMCVGKEDR